MAQKDNTPVVETEVTPVAIDLNEVLAKVVRDEDGNFRVVDKDGTTGEPCKLVMDGDTPGIALTKNAANRWWLNRNKATRLIDEDGFVPLTYRASRTLGTSTSRTPNEKLISYLSEEDKAEYAAIIARAIAARDADKKQPLTELEKLKKKIADAEAKLAKLLAEQV